MATTDDPNVPWLTVIGVAADVRSYSLEVKPRPQIYTTMEQNTDNELTFVLRTEPVTSASLMRAVRAEIKALDPTLPVADFRSMDTLMSRAIARPRFSTFLLGLFAATDACVGYSCGVLHSCATRGKG
jgi:hypothetical protein